MNTNKLPNLGSTGWGKSLNDYIKGIETRVSDIEHGLNEAREPEKVFNISSGVVGFGGKMKQEGNDLESGEELDSEIPCFWEGNVFFKDTGDGFSLNVTMDENTNFSPGALALEIGWNPVYLFFEDGDVTYRVDSANAYLTHPLVILLGFIFYDGSKKYWYYKTSRSEENTYEKRFMLTKPLAKFNSTFSVGVSGDRYAIIGKQVGMADPTLTLNAMGINYENSSISSEELVRGPDYKEFTVDENTPIVWATTNSITFGSSSGFELSSDRSIHRVYFSNIGSYVIQSEKYNGNDDFSSVVSYGFQPMNTNLERYGDLVELFRFVTVGIEGEGDFINVYQAIGSGIPPVDSFGVVPEVNYVSREGSNNIQFTDSNNNYFTLVGQNYGEDATPKVIRFNFNNSDDNYNYHALMNYTDISTTNGVQLKGANTTVYDFTTNNLNLELSQNRYIKMGIASGFPGIELKNGNSVVSMNNDGVLNIQADTNKRLWMGYTEEEGSGVGLRNDESRIVLADNGNIGLSSQNIDLYAGVDIRLTATGLTAFGDNIDLTASKIVLENPIQPGWDNIEIEDGVLSSYSLPEDSLPKLNWQIRKNEAEFPALKVGSSLKVGADNYKLVFLNDVDLVTVHSDAGVYWEGTSQEKQWVYYANDPTLWDSLSPKVERTDGNTGIEYLEEAYPAMSWAPGTYGRTLGPLGIWDGCIFVVTNKKKYLLNNFPVLGKQGFTAKVIWQNYQGESESYTFWHGNFPLNFPSTEGETRSVVVEALGATGNETVLAIYNNSSWGKYIAEVSVIIEHFTGWAWEVIGI